MNAQNNNMDAKKYNHKKLAREFLILKIYDKLRRSKKRLLKVVSQIFYYFHPSLKILIINVKFYHRSYFVMKQDEQEDFLRRIKARQYF